MPTPVPMPVPMPMLDRDGVGIHHEVRGSGRAVLLGHGFTLTCRIWGRQNAALQGSHRVIVRDMCGHGQSGAPGD